MGRTYYGKNGKDFDTNIEGGRFLDQITFGLFKKIGCYPKTDEDCKIVARILRNRVNLNQYWSPFFLEYGVENEGEGAIKWMKEAVEFFENCGGCMEEEEWYEKFGGGEP